MNIYHALVAATSGNPRPRSISLTGADKAALVAAPETDPDVLLDPPGA